MIKTVKVKYQFKFLELLHWIKENDIKGREFVNDNGEKVFMVHVNGLFTFNEFTYGDDVLYEVEEEEEVTKNTPFGWLVAVNSYGSLERYEVATITDVLSDDGADCFATKIYALIGNKLELIWESESDE